MTRATRHGTLTPGQAVTVNLGIDADVIEVANRSAEGVIWFTIDGATPVAEGNNTEVVPATSALELPRRAAGNAVVKLVSAEACDYSVAGSTR